MRRLEAEGKEASIEQTRRYCKTLQCTVRGERILLCLAAGGERRGRDVT